MWVVFPIDRSVSNFYFRLFDRFFGVLEEVGQHLKNLVLVRLDGEVGL